MMQLNVTPDFKKRSLKFKPEFPAAAKLESVELVIPNPDGEIKTAGLSFIIYSARCGGRKLAVCDAFTGTGTITGTLNLCTDRMVDEFYHLPLGTRRSFHAVLWSEADQWMIGAGRIAIANNPGSDSMNPAPLPADRYPTFEEVEEMIRNSGGLDEPVVRRVNGIAPDNAGNVSITIPGDVSELKDKDGLTLTVQQKNTLATLSTTYASKNHTHSEYALKADVNGLADELSRKLTVPAGGNAGQFLMKTVSGCGWSSIDLASYITITQARNEFAAKTHEHSQYALASALQDYAAKVHTHVIGDVTGLQDALDGKAAADHNHDSVYAPKEATAAALNAKLTIPAGGTAGQVIGKTSDGYGWITVSGGVSSWNDLTDKPSAFPPATHNHVIGDVTGLENKLSEKISSVNGQVPNSSGAVTLPVATSKADGLMSAADKEKLDGLDTTGSAGDMLKSVYDTDDDGIVDHAATADAVGATTAAQVADAVGKAHTHANKATLDKLAEADGKLTYDGAEIGGGSGTVKSVNGQLPDESGNVTVETGSTVDESRLLPALDSVPVDRSGNPVVFKAVFEGMDEHTLLYCPFDADFNDHSSYARTVTHDTSRAGLSISLERNKFGTGSLQGTGYTTAGAVYVQMPTPIGAADFTIHKWIYVTSAADRFGIFSTYGEAGSGTGTPGYGVDGLACWIDTDGTLKLYKASAHFSSYWYDDDSGNKLAEAAMPSDYLNRWVHIAVARSGNIWMLFADGSLLNSNSKEFNAVQPYLRIGSADSKATAYGNIDEFIVLDYAKWITDFEPPTQPATTLIKSYEVSDKGSGTVKSVNGQTPDSSGVVTLPAATVSTAGLMAAADKAVIAGLTARGIYPNALAKSGAIDFNEVIDHGFYFIGGDTPHLNYPETYQQTGGTLQVIRMGNYLTQTLILFDKNKSFNRSCFNATSGSSERKFSAWQRLLTDAEITESKARPGYFKLPSGIIVQWGAVLNITADGTTSATLPIAFPNSAFVATATATGSGLIASAAFDGNSKLNVIVKGYPGSGNFTIYWIAIGQ